jgi:hypothetical protein
MALGIFDFAVGFLTIWPGAIRNITMIIGIIALLKGISSLIGSLASGFWFDFMGVIDLIAGLALIFVWEVPYLWLPLFLKGGWSLLMGLASGV